MIRVARRSAFALGIFLCLSGGPLFAHGPWVVLSGCRLIPNESNDGDSFHVSAGGKEYIFRLYFVDAPETDASFPARVDEQARYFNLTRAQALQLGDFAKHFAKEKMTRSFTVRTCMQDAMGRSALERFYAFLGTSDGDLGELLVANGLARLHGSQATPVGLSSPEREWQKLERLEREARQARVGGWGAPFGRMTARVPRQPSVAGADSFDAFFHPERVASPDEAALILRSASAAAAATPAPSAGGKLDINNASSAELLAIRGVGPVMASRIIAARPFKSADDLKKVKGIGPKKYAELRPLFH